MNELYIENRKIGLQEKPLVIAEIGINHGGSLTVAKEMVDAAHRAGAEIVKHQTHVVDDEMSSAAKQVVPGNAKESIYEIMAKCALTKDEEFELMNYISQKGMIFLSTPFSRAAADRLEEFQVSAYKIGSGELNHYPLIEHIAKFGKPMILSTGMNDIESIKKATDILEKYNVPYALLHTTNLYPTKPEQVRLGAMLELQKHFPQIPFGLSDHTLNNNACMSAVALGASIVERHFVDHKDRIGPDVLCSMDELELQNLISDTAEIALMRNGQKRALIEEKVTSDFAFATLVSISDIKKGEKLTEKNIWAKRPGTGTMKAEKYWEILGTYAKKDIPKDTQIDYDMLEAKL